MNRCKYANNGNNFYLKFITDNEDLKKEIFYLIRNGQIDRNKIIFPKDSPNGFFLIYYIIDKTLVKVDKNGSIDLNSFLYSDKSIKEMKSVFEKLDEYFPSDDEIIDGLDIANKFDIADKAPSKEQIMNANLKFEDYIDSFLKNIANNKEILDNIKALMMKYSDGHIYGVPYSGKNPILIVSQKSDATFVTTRKKWFEDFNRVINDSATAIVVSYNSGDFSLDKAKQAYGLQGNERMNSHQKSSKSFNKSGGLGGGITGPFIAYDISDTTLIPNSEDVFNTEKGLRDNLRGIANEVLVNTWKEELEKSDNDEDKKKLQNNIDSINNNGQSKTDPSIIISNANKALNGNFSSAQEAIEALILHDNWIERDYGNKASDVKICILFLEYFCGLTNSDNILNNSSLINGLTKKELINVWHVINNVASIITSPITESRNNSFISIDKLLTFLGINKDIFFKSGSEDVIKSDDEMNKEMHESILKKIDYKHITESFNNFYNRINKHE